MSAIESIKTFFLTAGATWVVYLLGALSLVSLGVAIERWLVFREGGGDLRGLALALDGHLMRGDHQGAIGELVRQRSIAARIAAAGLRLAHLGPAAADKAMASARALEKSRLDKRLVFLGTLGNNAPFLGLFGTVVGIIQAFAELGSHSATGGAAVAASQGTSDAVMTAIAEALVTTAIGIAVALPAVAAYNYFVRRIAGLMSSAEVLSNLVLAYLSASRTPGRPSDERGGT